MDGNYSGWYIAIVIIIRLTIWLSKGNQLDVDNHMRGSIATGGSLKWFVYKGKLHLNGWSRGVSRKIVMSDDRNEIEWDLQWWIITWSRLIHNGFQSHGGTPITGWFTTWKIQLDWMMTTGNPIEAMWLPRFLPRAARPCEASAAPSARASAASATRPVQQITATTRAEARSDEVIALRWSRAENWDDV